MVKAHPENATPVGGLPRPDRPGRGRVASAFISWSLSLSLGLGLAVPAPAAAQPDAQALKAAIVFNLLQFVQWPNEAALPPSSPLSMCVDRQGSLWGPLSALQARPVRGQRVLQVRDWPAEADSLRSCHAVLAEPPLRRGGLAPLAGQPVLVIADTDRVDEAGVIIGVRMQGERLSFDIDLGAARRNGLQISSKLLRLAGKVQE